MITENGKNYWIITVPLIALIFTLLVIHPVTATTYFGEYIIGGRVWNTADDQIVCAAKAFLYQTEAKPLYYPWNGYSTAGWKVTPYGGTCPQGIGIIDISKCTAGSGDKGFSFQQTIPPSGNPPPRYWYIHVDPPQGFKSVSAKSLNSFGYGTVIDSQSIFFDSSELPPLVYEVEFKVAPLPGTPNYAGEICDDTIGVREFYQNEEPEPPAPSYAHVKAPAVNDTPAPQMVADLPPVGRNDKKVSSISQMPCQEGEIRCDGQCVDTMTDLTHCGSCGFVCGPGLSCKEGRCIGEGMKGITGEWYRPLTSLFQPDPTQTLMTYDAGQTGIIQPGDEAGAGNNAGPWYQTFFSLPQTFMSFIQPPPDLSSENGKSVSGRESLVQEQSMKAGSGESGEGPMQVVVLPGTDNQMKEQSAVPQDSVQVVRISDQPISIQPPPDIPQYTGSGNGIIPTEVPTQTYQISLPQDSIGNRPQVANDTFRCPSGYSTCNGICVDFKTDLAYCGNCNNTCPSQFTCVAGVCTQSCSSGRTLCNGVCTNLLTDTNNCGACGYACTSGGWCENGQCVLRMATTQETQIGGIGMTRQHL